ncbi:hypothetical protein MNV49_004067 [Pseudohyphozyma bogoriensis]|nr:hypothetical protein MNV49_004067 [Pseudohyphozyma bogoriensis]
MSFFTIFISPISPTRRFHTGVAALRPAFSRPRESRVVRPTTRFEERIRNDVVDGDISFDERLVKAEELAKEDVELGKSNAASIKGFLEDDREEAKAKSEKKKASFEREKIFWCRYRGILGALTFGFGGGSMFSNRTYLKEKFQDALFPLVGRRADQSLLPAEGRKRL